MNFSRWYIFSWLISLYESYFKPLPNPTGCMDFSWYKGLHKEPCPMPISRYKRCHEPANILCLVDCATPTGGHVDAVKKLCLKHACESATFKLIANLPRPQPVANGNGK